MRHLYKSFGVVLLLASLASAGAFVQFVESAACTTTSATCDLTVAATTAGNGGIIAIGTSISNTISSTSGAGTWSLCASSGCANSQGSVRWTDATYNVSLTGGVTLITVTRNNATSTAWRAMFWEFSPTSGTTFALDTFNTRAQGSATTSPAGVTLTLTGTNDVIAQAIKTAGTPSAISSPYTFNGTQSGLGGGYAVNTSSGTAPTWTQTSAACVMTAVALKEVSSSVVRHAKGGPY